MIRPGHVHAGPPHARVPRGRTHRRVVALRRAGRRPRRRAVARRRLQAARRGGWCGCRVQARPRRPRRRRLVCGPALGSALVWSPRPGGGAPGVEPVGAGGGGRHGARLDAVRRAPPARLAPAERARRPGGRRGARDALSQRCTELLSEASAAAPSDKPPLCVPEGERTENGPLDYTLTERYEKERQAGGGVGRGRTRSKKRNSKEKKHHG